MKKVQSLIQLKKQEYAQWSLVWFMKDPNMDPRQRLSFAAGVAHS